MEKIFNAKITEVVYREGETQPEATIECEGLPDIEINGKFTKEDVGKKIKIMLEW
jgi:hypothetical protein